MENLITFGIALFTLVNPPGIVSVFLGLTSEYSAEKQKAAAYGTFFAVLTIMIIITWVGTYILSFFGIRPSSLKVAGALIIGMLGLSMLQDKKSDIKYSESKKQHLREHENTDTVQENHTNLPSAVTTEATDTYDEEQSIVVVPLSFPIIVGPGTISTIIAATTAVPGIVNRFYITGVCLLISLLLLFSLLFAVPIGKLLGKSGMSILTKIMGMLLLAIAVEMFVSGAKVLFPILA